MKSYRLLAAATVALSCLGITQPAQPTPGISYADRLRAQEAIERVYYAHQIGATKLFEEAVSGKVIETKVRTTLRQSVALETYWNTRVTDADLAREVDRMARTTRMPDRLRELFAALGNDPIRIRECLARPVLVSRLLRNFYATDPRIHAPARAEAEELRLHLGKGPTGPKDEHYARGLLELVREGTVGAEGQEADQQPTETRTEIGEPRRESVSDEELKDWRWRLVGKPGGVGEVREERGEFVVPVLLKDRSDAMTLAIYSVPKKPLEIWWREVEAGLDPAAARPVREPAAPPLKTVPEPATASPVIETASCTPVNTWDETSLLGALPLDRWYHTAIWTGSVMIVWGGYRGDGVPLNSGGRYDPATDTWEATSTVGAPEARERHSAVWTGTRMIVWGGSPSASVVLNSGGQYNPVSDTWTPTQLLGAPEPRFVHSVIWTGSEMLVWGGASSGHTAQWLQTGGRYNPDTDSWLPITTAGAPTGRNAHVAVWTGAKMIIWGGLVTNDVYTNTGGRYDPSADTWETTSLAGAPSPRSHATAVWTGTRMIVWSGEISSNTGGQYDPVLDNWTATSTSGAPIPRSEATSIWTGTHMIVWGGTGTPSSMDTGGRYDPASNTWTATSTTGAPAARWAHSAIWTGNKMIIWGGVIFTNMTNTGGRYDPSTDSWSPTAIGDAPPALSGQTAVWTGSRMIVWGGGRFGLSQVGGRYDPALNEWTPTSLLSAPSARASHTAVWAGSRLIIWGGQTGGLGTWTNTGGRYDPITDTWSPTSVIGAPSPRRLHSAVWTGNRMIVWGGSDTSPESNTGGRYDPDADTWLPTSLTNAPASRVKHTAIWTGSRMIIWGGSSSQTSVYLNTGGVYDPVTDAWSPTSFLGTLPGRVEHTAIWTGSQMIVWGGRINVNACSTEFRFLDTGGRYDPVSDTWSLTSAFPLVNGDSGRRAGHTAVWNGSPGAGEMIVWGGYKDVVFEPNCNTRIYPAGGRYNPVSDTWTLMTTPPAPEPRAFHSAVSTGNLMLIWGGEGGTSQQRPLRDGGSYVLVEDFDGDSFGSCDGDCNDTDPSIHPGAVEVCNGVDDNCNGTTDEVDQDGDGMTACNGDCNDLDPGSWDFPVELSGVIVGQSVPTNLSWSDVGPVIGPGVTYDMASGSMGPGTGINFSSGACLQSGLGSPSYADPRISPSPGGGYWYLVRSRNSCGIGTYGASSSGAERILPSCP